MSWFEQKRIFLDYASATPVLPEVKQVMEKYGSKVFYNPSAIYKEGLFVKKDIEQYRTRVARALGVAQQGIVFTSGGTESDNLAVLGTFETLRESQNKKPHIIISSIEHPSVIASAKEVVRRGGEMSILKVNEEGVVSIEALSKLIKRNTFLISIGLANNEIGTIQPIPKIGRLVREYRKTHKSIYPYLHTDASQTPSFLSTNLESLQTDLMTLDASKIYGPKGVGVLALRAGVKIHPTIFGGDQEGGRRAGTPNSALIAGFTLALELAQKNKEKESSRLESFRKYFIETIKKNVPKAIFNGSISSHLPNIVSVSVPGIMSEFVLLKLDREGVLASVGSACSFDGKISGSSVIRALGKTELSESTLRFSFGRFTNENDVRQAVKIFCRLIGVVVK
ncbi:MAG: Cysteine desulfurase [Parcubacteria group bacterium GW2011_GWB1_38_8]|nr:MAG: Cysteine desulfurase [Parcubacteria group bacterium GW2011_GWB1_38_8]OHA95232.1 MAG: hypothetical protein A3C62_00210 [Candidatus Zambryskibacteria bacterium RIFCSPHIGHO2_02_FULL_39_16]